MQKVFPFYDIIMVKLVYIRLESEGFSKDRFFAGPIAGRHTSRILPAQSQMVSAILAE